MASPEMRIGRAALPRGQAAQQRRPTIRIGHVFGESL
jgi:hypothetical protein